MQKITFKRMDDRSTDLGAVVERNGVHFGYCASGTELPVLLLYKKGTEEIAEEIPFPPSPLGDRSHFMKLVFDSSQYEYNFREGERVVTDPYARRICGRETFGKEPSASPHGIRGGFVKSRYDWGADRLPGISREDAVMYHLHVRSFTMQKNSGVRKKGTFAGLMEKIPYLKELGINQVKLMPVYDFPELMPKIPEHTKTQGTHRLAKAAKPADTSGTRPENREEKAAQPATYKLNLWGYGEGFYFALKSSYAYGKDPEREFKDMVKAFHANGIEVILEFCFQESSDISMITQCLSYWAQEYHIDGFSVIARESVICELARLPLFQTRKLICNWYPDHIKEWNEKEGHALLAESNDGFMNDCRRLLKGDESVLQPFSSRIRCNPAGCGCINYMTDHDGFTLMDLVSYDSKHNLDNGEQNRDGTDYNYSWNCGVEGASKRKEIRTLRMRQRKNAYAMLLFSQGTPMLLAGDEFGNSQNGNNNPYCQDNEVSWVDWSGRKRDSELTEFVKQAVAYRKTHKVLRQKRQLQGTDYLSTGYPDLSFHGNRAWYGDFDHIRRHIGCMYAGEYAGEKGFLYIAYNLHWNKQEFALPLLPKGEAWYKAMDTSLKESFVPEDKQEHLSGEKFFTVPPRTVVILEGR